MKFLLNNTTANYSCLWCLIYNDNRWDTSKPLDNYTEEKFQRTLDGIKASLSSKDNHGCINAPLLDIPLSHIIPDELHLLLGVTDRLLENIITKVVERCHSRL